MPAPHPISDPNPTDNIYRISDIRLSGKNHYPPITKMIINHFIDTPLVVQGGKQGHQQ